MGIILKLYLKTGISLCLEGRIMLTIIDMTMIFTRGEKVEEVYFWNLQDQLIDSTPKKVLRGVNSGKLKVGTFNFRNIFYKAIKLGKL